MMQASDESNWGAKVQTVKKASDLEVLKDLEILHQEKK